MPDGYLVGQWSEAWIGIAAKVFRFVVQWRLLRVGEVPGGMGSATRKLVGAANLKVLIRFYCGSNRVLIGLVAFKSKAPFAV